MNSSFAEYNRQYERLGYKHFPLNRVFSWCEHDGPLQSPSNRKLAVEYTMDKASKILQKQFDVRRSYHENNGYFDALEQDVLCMFWALFRKEFPSEKNMRDYPFQYRTSVRMNLADIRSRIDQNKSRKYAEDRLRGAQKRYTKEKDFINKIGETAFNQKMKHDKTVKYSQGPNSDKDYLKFVQWRKEELAKGTSIYLRSHTQSFEVKVDKGHIRLNKAIACIQHFVVKDGFSSLLYDILKMEKYKVELTIKEGGFGEFPMQCVWLNLAFLKIDGALRAKEISGVVEVYAQHPKHGLLISFTNSKTPIRIAYPTEYRKYMEYTDPVTGDFMGIPQSCCTMCNKLHTVKGHVEAKLMLIDESKPGGIILNIKNFGTDEVAHRAEDIARKRALIIGLKFDSHFFFRVRFGSHFFYFSTKKLEDASCWIHLRIQGHCIRLCGVCWTDSPTSRPERHRSPICRSDAI